jgi:hypothetical protein
MLALWGYLNGWWDKMVLILGVGRTTWKAYAESEMIHLFGLSASLISVYHNPDLEQAQRLVQGCKNTAFFVDEPQQGLSGEQVQGLTYETYAFFRTARLASMKDMMDSNNHIIFASATPNEVLIDAQEHKHDFVMIRPPHPPTYFGVDDILISPTYIPYDQPFWPVSDTTMTADRLRRRHLDLLCGLMLINQRERHASGYWILRVPPECANARMRDIVNAIQTVTHSHGLNVAVVPLTSELGFDRPSPPGHVIQGRETHVHSELTQPTEVFLDIIERRLHSDPAPLNNGQIYLADRTHPRDVVVIVKGKFQFSDRVSQNHLKLWWTGCQSSFDLYNQDVGRACGNNKSYGVWIIGPKEPLEEQKIFLQTGEYRQCNRWESRSTKASRHACDGGAQYASQHSFIGTIRRLTELDEDVRSADRLRNRDALGEYPLKKMMKYASEATETIDVVNQYIQDMSVHHTTVIPRVYHPIGVQRAKIGFCYVMLSPYLVYEEGRLVLPDNQFELLSQEMQSEVDRKWSELRRTHAHLRQPPQFFTGRPTRSNPIVLVRERVYGINRETGVRNYPDAVLDEGGNRWPCSLFPERLEPMAIQDMIRHQRVRYFTDEYVHPCIVYGNGRFESSGMMWVISFSLSYRERMLDSEEAEVQNAFMSTDPRSRRMSSERVEEVMDESM